VLCVAVIVALFGLARGNEQETFFETKIRPVLVEHCYSCHSQEAKTLQGNLLLDAPSLMRKGGDSGPAVVPSKPDESLLLSALKYDAFQMPPKGKLPDEVIANFSKWIADGAFDPRVEGTPSSATSIEQKREVAKAHWSFQPVKSYSVPDIASDWSYTPLDRFIEQKAKEAGMVMTKDVEKSALLRRMYLDLIGIPPTPEEVLYFLDDKNPDAIERVVDRLLASPHYGERWGRHWLDLARYADSNGADENHEYPVAFRYRDYVVRQLNDDLPYDEFVIQQLSGDLLTTDSLEERKENLTATGFLVLGPKMLAEQDKPKLVADLVDEQVDTIGQALLGLTLGCARCHDHKFDPITATDYYALAGIFHSTKTMEHLNFVSQWNTRELPDPVVEQQISAHQVRITEAEAMLNQLSAKPEAERSDADKMAIENAKKSVEQLKKEAPALPRVMAVDEAAVKVVPVHVRGNHLQLRGDPIPRRLPSILESTIPQPQMPESKSGRYELALSLFHPQHPLTSRVMVNRLWFWHFGEGIVRSVSNFGLKGESPSHPELLDWLSEEFRRQQWSLKNMHRKLMLSHTYRLSTVADSHSMTTDPDNRLFTRRTIKRLEIEPLRDSIISIGGNLDRQFGGKATASYGANYAEDGRGKNEFDALRRTIYLPINRAALHELFSTFDYVDSGVSVGKRTTTVVPHQALFLMNHPLVRQQAHELASRLATHPLRNHSILRHHDDHTAKIQILFLSTVGRLADASEFALAYQFHQSAFQVFAAEAAGDPAKISEADRNAWTELCHAMMTGNEFMYIP
jgi:hypothetical protein